MEINNCLNCKYASTINGSYCYCKKKYNRVQISKQADCKKYQKMEVKL